jgi:hypothetical protein
MIDLLLKGESNIAFNGFSSDIFRKRWVALITCMSSPTVNQTFVVGSVTLEQELIPYPEV